MVFITKKAVRMAALLVMVSLVTFALISASPIDPLQANAGQALGSMSQEQREKLESYWGVGEPPARRYVNWAKDVLQGDMGTSLLYRQPVTEVIGTKLFNGPGNCSCRVPGTVAGPPDSGVCPFNGQHAGILAGPAASSGVFCVA